MHEDTSFPRTGIVGVVVHEVGIVPTDLGRCTVQVLPVVEPPVSLRIHLLSLLQKILNREYQ